MVNHLLDIQAAIHPYRAEPEQRNYITQVQQSAGLDANPHNQLDREAMERLKQQLVGSPTVKVH